MLFKGVAEEGGEFVTALMLVLVVLLGFGRRGARRAKGTPWSSGRAAIECSMRALVRVASKLAGASVLDESES